MPPQTEASKAIVHALGRGGGQQVVAVVGQQGLVGGDHVLAPGDGGQGEVPGRAQAADELHHDVDLRVVQEVLGPGGE